jgi:hypothetical protein
MPRDRAIRNGQKPGVMSAQNESSLRTKRGNLVATVALDCRASLAMTVLLTNAQQKNTPGLSARDAFLIRQ